jgi:hypothetical protein
VTEIDVRAVRAERVVDTDRRSAARNAGRCTTGADAVAGVAGADVRRAPEVEAVPGAPHPATHPTSAIAIQARTARELAIRVRPQ